MRWFLHNILQGNTCTRPEPEFVIPGPDNLIPITPLRVTKRLSRIKKNLKFSLLVFQTLPDAKCHKCLNPFSYFGLWHLLFFILNQKPCICHFFCDFIISLTYYDIPQWLKSRFFCGEKIKKNVYMHFYYTFFYFYCNVWTQTLTLTSCSFWKSSCR